MTPVFCCGFECGVSGSHWTAGATFSFDTTTKRNGARSVKCTNPTTTSELTCNAISGTATIYVGRFYLYFDTLPNGVCFLLRLYDSGATNTLAAVRFENSDNKIYASTSSGNGASGVSVTTGQWYRIDFKVNAAGDPVTMDVSVNGEACGQAQRSGPNSTSLLRLGRSNGGTLTAAFYYDDFILSETAADFPIGNGKVLHFIPTADGTHNIAGTADFQRTLTGTDILNATTTAYQLVDDVPLESGASVDWINMILPPNATDYVECIFGPAPSVPTPVYGPRAVEVIAGIHQAGTGTGNMAILLRDNATSGTIYTATTVAGVTSVAYKRAHFATPPSGGAWGVAAGNGNFNNLRFRFGSPAAVDANPDQYLDCIMIEAEFAEVFGKSTNIKQAVNRAGTY